MDGGGLRRLVFLGEEGREPFPAVDEGIEGGEAGYEYCGGHFGEGPYAWDDVFVCFGGTLVFNLLLI